MKKRILCLVLAALMICSVLPLTALAADTQVTATLKSGSTSFYSGIASKLVYTVKNGTGAYESSELTADIDGSSEGVSVEATSTGWTVTASAATLNALSENVHVLNIRPSDSPAITVKLTAKASTEPTIAVSSGKDKFLFGSATAALKLTVTDGTGKYHTTGVSAVTIDGSAASGVTFSSSSMTVTISKSALNALEVGSHTVAVTTYVTGSYESCVLDDITIEVTSGEPATLTKNTVPKNDSIIYGAASSSIVLTVNNGTGDRLSTGIDTAVITGPKEVNIKSYFTNYKLTLPVSVINKLPVGDYTITIETKPATGCTSTVLTYEFSVIKGESATLEKTSGADTFAYKKASAALVLTVKQGTGAYKADSISASLSGATSLNLDGYCSGMVLTLDKALLNGLSVGEYTVSVQTLDSEGNVIETLTHTVTVYEGSEPGIDLIDGKESFTKGKATSDITYSATFGSGTFACDAISKVLVDTATSQPEEITFSGSTIWVSKTLLNALTAGEHTLTFYFSNGGAEIDKTITRTVTVSDGTPATVSPASYTVPANNTSSVTFTVTKGTGAYDCDGIAAVTVDGASVSGSSNMTVSGLKLTLTASYLKTLKSGDHVLKIYTKKADVANGSYVEATITVGKTAAPTFSDGRLYTMSSSTSKTAVFTMDKAYDGAVTVKLYTSSACTEVYSGATAAVSGTTLTITFTSNVKKAVVLYATFAAGGVAESDPVELGVNPYSASAVATLSGISYRIGTDESVAIADFSPTTLSYKVSLPSTTAKNASIVLLGTTTSSNATMNPVSERIVTLSDGKGSGQIVVTSFDGTATVTYKVEFEIGTDSGYDWDGLIAKINAAKEGASVSANVTSSTLIPKKVMTALKGRDVTLRLTTGGGAGVTVINGKDVVTARDTEIGYKVNSGKIPADKRQSVTKNSAGGSYPYIELEYNSSTAWGHSQTLDVYYGPASAGKYVNVYTYYTTGSGYLLLNDAVRINRAGYAKVPLTGPGSYLLVTDSENRTWTDDIPFTDVPDNAWYHRNLYLAYHLDIIHGRTSTTFDPNGNLTVAEAIKLADDIYQLYHDGKITLKKSETGFWYQSFVDFALVKGIITSGQFTDYNASVTRAQVADIFYKVLSTMDYEKINTVKNDAIPDVKAADSTIPSKTYTAIYELYRAGILVGDAKTTNTQGGTFRPASNITRAEIASICVRMLYDDVRVSPSFD